jgi:S-adenosylmethionine decarboxylase
MHGLHLTADLHHCHCDGGGLMRDLDALRALCLRTVLQVGLQPVGELFHRFTPLSVEEPAGITGMVLLAESHLAVHTWPELASVTLDVYVCNVHADNSARAQVLLDKLIQAFAPTHLEQHALQRGRTTAGINPVLSKK